MTQTPEQDRVATDHLRDYSRLRRSTTDRKVAGVAGGLGRHLNIDPTVLRVAFVVLSFFGGSGLLLYGAAWLLVPEEGKDQAIIETSPGARNGLLLAAAVVAGLLVVGDSWGGFGFPWPLVLVGVVLLLLLTFREYPMRQQTTPPPGASGATDAPGTATYPATASEATASGATGTAGHDAPPPLPPWAAPPGPAYPAPPPSTPASDRGPRLFWVTVALVAIALGTLGMYDVWRGGVVDGAYPALALAVVGAMLVVGAWVGRAGGLIVLGVVSALALLATSVSSPRFDGDHRLDVAPSSAAQVHDLYSVPAGSVRLDLTRVGNIAALDGRRIDVEANAGDLEVILPEGLDAEITADISVAGEARLPHRNDSGPDVFVRDTVDDGGPDAPEIDLHLDLVVGSIEVRQQ